MPHELAGTGIEKEDWEVDWVVVDEEEKLLCKLEKLGRFMMGEARNILSALAIRCRKLTDLSPDR